MLPGRALTTTHAHTLEFISERKMERDVQMSVLLDRLDPVEERRVDEAEDGEAAAHDGAQLREEAAEALALLTVHDAVPVCGLGRRSTALGGPLEGWQVALKRLGALPRIRRGAQGRGCGREGSGALLLARAAAVSTG